jgi:hypothetical protein
MRAGLLGGEREQLGSGAIVAGFQSFNKKPR